jgi:hypothetical protein
MQTSFMTLLDAAVSGAGPTRGPNSTGGAQSFHAVHTASSSLSSTINIEVSNYPTSSMVAGHWVTLGTITLVGSSVISDSFVSEAPYKWFRANIISASGASTAISVYMGQSL